MKTVAWLPDDLNANKSFTMFKKAFELAGFKNISNEEFYKDLKNTDYLVLNFYEDINKKLGTYFISFFGKLFRLKRFQHHKIKIIWFLNNKLSHDKKGSYWTLKMMKILIRKSFKIICLCHDSTQVLKKLQTNEKLWEEKLIFLPHPNYIGCYNTQTKCEFPKEFSILFFGSIRPYKNIDTLINVVKTLPLNHCNLTIAGQAKDINYEKHLQNISKGTSNIDLHLKFIPDDKLLQLINKSSIVVLPYDNETTLNSGSILLTCSAARTFISPKIGTINDFPDKTLFYSYSYNSQKEHEKVLKEKILEAYTDFEKNPTILEEKGKKLYEYVKQEHSVQKLAEIIKKNLC